MALSFQDFADQLSRCAQSDEEAVAFMEAFARVRLEVITKALTAPLDALAAETEEEVAPDWSNDNLLAESAIRREDVAGVNGPEKRYLHIEVAVARQKSVISVFLDMTGLSDKQRGDLFPLLSTERREAERSALALEVQRLNRHLDWIRSRGVQPETFLAYHRNLGIHGASQNAGGAVGGMGAALAFIDALNEISPGCIDTIIGAPLFAPPGRSPEEIAEYLFAGSEKEREAKRIRILALTNGRFVVFSSDPDVSIFMPLSLPMSASSASKGKGKPKVVTYATRAEAALALYNKVRQQSAARRQNLHEFAVGEVKTATDPSNLHERLALGSRETKIEVNCDRFLLMALLTKDLIEGGSGKRSGRTPLQNRDTVRFSDVFNLHFAWGWDGARQRHPEHWAAFKARLKDWCGL